MSDGFLLESSPWHNESGIFMQLKIPWPTAIVICIESESKLLSLPLIIFRVVVHGLFSDWQEQPRPPPNYKMMLLLLLLAEITELLLPWGPALSDSLQGLRKGTIWLSQCYQLGVIFRWTPPMSWKGLVHIPAATMLHSWWPFGHNADHMMDFQGCRVLKLPEQHMLHQCNANLYLAIIEIGKWEFATGMSNDARCTIVYSASNMVHLLVARKYILYDTVHAPDFSGLTFILAALMFLIIQLLDHSTFIDSVLVQRQRFRVD